MKLFYATAMAVLFAWPAFAEPSCGSYRGFTSELHTVHKETVIDELRTETQRGALVWQLWANPETKAWTITAYIDGETGTAGGMCAFNAGDDYHGISLEAFVNGTAT